MLDDMLCMTWMDEEETKTRNDMKFGIVKTIIFLLSGYSYED
jgi:hypothetical protein